ncbi:unnamed protein product [Dibothriocephalus latus]|uniref:Laminin G domain-containing protein n=1 Tax=Dibothriocephalus latus TaxID=60516 RepID=A0A3P7LY54_DIBLA|nr:unnamed protein product [Dibothriocephalus latus]
MHWHHPTRAGFLTLREVFAPLPGFNVRLDDGQWHNVRLERNAKAVSFQLCITTR